MNGNILFYNRYYLCLIFLLSYHLLNFNCSLNIKELLFGPFISLYSLQNIILMGTVLLLLNRFYFKIPLKLDKLY